VFCVSNDEETVVAAARSKVGVGVSGLVPDAMLYRVPNPVMPWLILDLRYFSISTDFIVNMVLSACCPWASGRQSLFQRLIRGSGEAGSGDWTGRWPGDKAYKVRPLATKVRVLSDVDIHGIVLRDRDTCQLLATGKTGRGRYWIASWCESKKRLELLVGNSQDSSA
jgi:hypothetical protein